MTPTVLQAEEIKAAISHYIRTKQDAEVFHRNNPYHADNSEYYGPAVAFAWDKVERLITKKIFKGS